MKRNPDSSSSKQLSDHEGMHSEQWNFLQELGMMVTSHQLSTLDFSYFRKIYSLPLLRDNCHETASS